MNKKIKIVLMILLFFLLIIAFPKKSEATDLDEILNYTTIVSPRDDGTLDIKYHIEWKVLDSTTAGPLKWVTIGIPNQHVDSIKKLSSNISKIKYSSKGGNYVRIDFKTKYKAGEVVTFEFSLHQSYMYTIHNSTGIVSYEFTPGWFSDIRVDEAVIKWEAADIKKHNGSQSQDYIIWNKSLGKGQKITAKVEYPVSRFNVDYKKQYSKSTSTNNSSYFSNVIVIFIVLIVICAFIQCLTPSYYRHGGYGYYGGYYPHHHHYYGGFGGGFGGGSSSGGSGGGSSCACACACAGGGRAGCAKKDFYGTNLKIRYSDISNDKK